jgi:hypothetical protein
MRAQKYSSFAFNAFAAMHFTNTALIPLITRSVPSSDKYLLLTRPYYQSFPLEPLLITIPILTHVGSGIALRLYHRRQQLERNGAESRSERKSIPWPHVSGISKLGYLLVPMVSFHAFTTRVLPMYLHGDNSIINLSYIAHGFELHPFVSFAGFTAFVTTATWHVVWGAAKWLGLTPNQVAHLEVDRPVIKKRRWYALNAIAAAVAGVWLGGALGVVGRGGATTGWIGRDFDELYAHIPMIRWSI